MAIARQHTSSQSRNIVAVDAFGRSTPINAVVIRAQRDDLLGQRRPDGSLYCCGRGRVARLAVEFRVVLGPRSILSPSKIPHLGDAEGGSTYGPGEKTSD